MIDIAYVLFGLVLLSLGGEGLVRGSVTIAEKMRLSALLVSTVIVGFGTSVPELLVSVSAALKGQPDIALGNVVGSNICNTLLILGVAAVITVIPCKDRQIRKDALAGVFASLFIAFLSFTNVISGAIGLAMIALLGAYLTYNIWQENDKNKRDVVAAEKIQMHIEEAKSAKSFSFGVAMAMLAVSLALLVFGADILVQGAVAIAKRSGVSEAVIGLTLVAFGTSLPEFATACIAAWRKHTDVIIGNVLGSNLFNILGILGVTAIVKPIPFGGRIAQMDVWIMLAVSALLVAVMMTRGKISRLEGGVMLALYLSYVFWLYFSVG